MCVCACFFLNFSFSSFPERWNKSRPVSSNKGQVVLDFTTALTTATTQIQSEQERNTPQLRYSFFAKPLFPRVNQREREADTPLDTSVRYQLSAY